MLSYDMKFLKDRFERQGFQVVVSPTPVYGEKVIVLKKDGNEERYLYVTKYFVDFEEKRTYVNDFINSCVNDFNNKFNEKKGTAEMNKNIMNLAAAKEAYLNCDGTIIPIKIDQIDWYVDDIKMVCTLPSVIETPYHEYCRKDTNMTNAINAMLNGSNSPVRRKNDPIGIKNVIFNPPATIVFWTDNTKTVVKAGEYDIYDPEKGIAMAITKKVLGNQGNYYNEVRKWLDKYEEPVYGGDFLAGGIIDNESIGHAIQKAFASFVRGADASCQE